jgi:hypothetical protein
MSILDTPVGQVTGDDRAFHRLLHSLEANTEMSYVDAMHVLLPADPRARVRDVLAGKVNLDAVATDVKTLEQRDDAVQRIELQAAELRTLDGDPSSGLPKIDGQAYSEVMRATPVSLERLFEARQLTGSTYDGPEGEGRFADEDRQLAAAGYDLVAGLRRGVANAGVQRTLNAAVQRMDSALANGADPSERRTLLQAAASEGVKQLDQAVSSARRSLDLEPANSTPTVGPDSSFAGAVRLLEERYGDDRAGFQGAYRHLLDSLTPTVTQTRQGPLVPIDPNSL